MRVEVIVPWGGDCEYRRKAFEWVAERYRWPVRIGLGGDPWVKADAVMPALYASDADLVVVADADCWTDGLPEALAAVEDGAPWAVPHAAVWRLDAEGSERYMAGEGIGNLPLDQRPYRGYRGGGFVVARRQTLIDIPLDPRFIGWGHEDNCWAWALMTLAGYPWRGTHPLVHLWHPPQPRPSRKHGSQASLDLERRYQAAFEKPDRMSELIGEIDRERFHVDKSHMYGNSPLGVGNG